MKIGINLLPLRPGKNGGMEVYVRNLLIKLLAIDSTNEYYLITGPYNESSLNFPNVNCNKILLHHEIIFSQKIRILYNKIIGKTDGPFRNLENIIDQYHLDLWFCPFLSLEPRPLIIPSLVTIPDIQHEYYPENFSNTERSLRKGYIQPSCEMATEIITISEFSKKSFIEKLGVDPEKIHVVYLAAGERFFHAQGNGNTVTKKHNLPNQYFFYPANGWPHKNHRALLKGFYLYRKSYKTPFHLILTGSGLKDTCDIQDRIAQYSLEEYVHILDYVDTEDLPDLYQNAKALVFPSLFEGFGIPLIEAMASGCPIIASNTTSIPEVAGDAAYLFDQKNPQSICDAMHRIVDDDALREKLIQNGKKRVTQYSYDKVARMHLDLFVSAYAKAKESKIVYNNE
jgi:glycosyltransferase involved in cell wall biosynthesis